MTNGTEEARLLPKGLSFQKPERPVDWVELVAADEKTKTPAWEIAVRFLTGKQLTAVFEEDMSQIQMQREITRLACGGKDGQFRGCTLSSLLKVHRGEIVPLPNDDEEAKRIRDGGEIPYTEGLFESILDDSMPGDFSAKIANRVMNWRQEVNVDLAGKGDVSGD